MPKYKPINRLSVADAIYMAGFIDGEGTISIHKDKTKYRPRVLVSNTNKEILEWIKEKIGRGCIQKREWSNKKWKPGYTWALEGLLPTKDFLSQIYGFLKIKQKNALMCLALPGLIQGHAETFKMRNEELTDLRDNLYKYSIQFNKRGMPDD